MAVQVDSSNQIDEFLRVLKRRIWWVIVPAAIIATFGVSYAILVPKKYVASTRLMVHDTRSDSGVGKDSTAEGRVAEHTIKSRRRILTVLDRLGWEEWLNLSSGDKESYLVRVTKNLGVEVPAIDRYAGQQLVKIAYAHTDPQKAFDFLLKLTDLWKEEVLEKTRTTLKEQLEKTETARREKEREASDLGEKIAGIRRRYGIRPGSGLGPFNQGPTAPEFEQLELTRQQISEVTETLAESSLQLETLLGRYDRLDSTRFEEVETNDRPSDPQAEKIAERISELESRVQEKGWLPENSNYKKAIREIESLEDELFALREDAGPTDFPFQEVENSEKVALGEEVNALDLEIDTNERRLEILQQREVELAGKTTELQSAFQEIEELEARRNQAQELSDIVAAEYYNIKTEVDYLEGPAGNPFTELEAVHAPNQPTEPNPVLLSIASIVAGLALGFGLAILLEYSKSVFRSVGDVSRAMTVPVLGTVNAITTRGQVRRMMFTRIVMSVATLAFVGVAGYLLWAYSYRPDLLSDSMLDNMTKVREALK